MSDPRSTPPSELETAFEVHRGALIVHCYRFLGSYHDAEEATQEAFLRAWRARDSFRGEASLKTWLHRIATRVCLDLLRSRSARMAPELRAAASSPIEPPGAPSPDIPWLEPIPTAIVTDAAVDPAAAFSASESVKLAFIAALQTLPPRQRAVLILRDVLAWSAAETADVLDMSVAAANSALNRARQQLRDTYHETGVDAFPGAEPDDPLVVRTLRAYVSAWERDDVDGLVQTVREDVRLAMPPVPDWYRGRDDVVTFLRTWIMPYGSFRLATAYANAQPAFVLWGRGSDGIEAPAGIQVITVDAQGIGAIDSFMSPELTKPYVEAPSAP